MSNFVQRSLTGLVFGAIVVASTTFNQWSFLALVFTINLLCLHEFYSLLLPKGAVIEKYFTLATGSIINIVFGLMVMDYISVEWFYHLIPLLLILFMAKLFFNSKTELDALSYEVLGLIYICFPLSMFYKLSFFNSLEFSYTLPLGIFLLQWTSDTGAYLIGKNFGKHKLFRRISPLKTIEGGIGGLVFTLAAAIVISKFWDDLSLTDWMVVAALIAVFGSIGDLFQSLLKRNIGIKDSGKLLPGHGGTLDRFDAIFFSVPAVYFYLMLTQ